MQKQRTRDPRLVGVDTDDQAQMAVLGHLLDAYPAQITVAELVTACTTPGERSFAEREEIERAVRDLNCAGLLHQRDEFVVPTRATARFGELVGR